MICAGQCLLEVIVGVVYVQHVDAVQSEPGQALLDRAHDSVIGEVEDGIERRHALVCLTWLRRRIATQQAPHFGGKHEFVARLGLQHHPQAVFGESVPIERRRVEEANARPPCGLDDAVCLVVGHRLEQATQGRAAEAEPSHLERRLAERRLIDRIQSSKIKESRSLLLPLKSCAFAIMGAISACQRMLTGSVARSPMARS